MKPASTLIIGIDGGGTGCRVAIADKDGTVLGTASAGPANYTTDPDMALRNILTALTDATQAAGLSKVRVAHATAHVGLAGIVTPEAATALAADLPFGACVVSDDQLTSVIGALGDRDGAVVSVGTGSFVAVKKGTKNRYIGGWGLHLGDQASGAWLGRQALQRGALVLDGLADSSDLIDTLLARFNGNPGHLIAFAAKATASAYAELARPVFAAANARDPNGVILVQDGAKYLNLCLQSAQLADTHVICLTGGLGPSYAQWLKPAHQARIVSPSGAALDGALQLARRRADQQ
ncbi:MAG: BadF/BadG/BcrA/BcrD ATPase family protein [Marivita sp.]|uniref:BadF/BadG/BcrA/BcrD ATPase family protein n=1 Tax=Marivita sp. TaxID=2003365 RepID=UPI003EF717CF